MQLASKVDTIVIMSGDSDYIELVRHLKSEGVRVEIASVDATTASIIKEECDHHYRINEDDWFTYAPKQAGGGKQNKRRSSKKSQSGGSQSDKQAVKSETSDKSDNKNSEEEKQPASNESDILSAVNEVSREYEPEYPQSQYIEN